jgi:hypothetical protein
MDIFIRIQPNLPVNTCPFIKPSFILRCISPYYQYIVPVKIDVVGYIIAFTYITAFVVAKEKTVEPDIGIPENTIELDLKS